jgi:hypothetical protein
MKPRAVPRLTASSLVDKMDDLPGKVIDGRNNEESKTLDVDK